MKPPLRLAAGLALALALDTHALATPAASAPTEAEQWITSWYAAPQPGWGSDFPLPMNVPASLDRQTLRETLMLSAGGRRVRLVFSNRYGQTALRIGAVRVGLADGTGPGAPLRFSGNTAVSIPPGGAVTSDPLSLVAPPLTRLVIRTYLPGPTPVTSFHWGAQQTIDVAAGDATAAPAAFDAPRAGRIEGRLFLSAVLVAAPAGSHTVVTLGDSITDGNGSTPERDRRWPDFLARRLAPHGVAVANAGISGARLLRDGMGQRAMARFEHDVLGQPGVSDVIVLLGINDIGWPGSPFAPQEAPVTLGQLAAGYTQLAAAAHARGVRVTVGTLPPFEGALEGTPYAGHYSPAKEALRQQLNAWIRTVGLFDAVVDFDARLRDPAHSRRLLPAFDSGDHLHPGDAGYQAMAAAIDIAPLLGAAEPVSAGQGAAR